MWIKHSVMLIFIKFKWGKCGFYTLFTVLCCMFEIFYNEKKRKVSTFLYLTSLKYNVVVT